MEKKPKIEYGDVNIPEEAFEPRNQKIRISIMVAGDVLDAFKKAAAEQNKGYQTLMQEVLRDGISQSGKTNTERIAALERTVKSLVGDIIESEPRISRRTSVAARERRTRGARR